MSAALCGGGVYSRRVMRCPTEDRRRRFVVFDAAWYDPVFTCCGCGDSWSTEGRAQRPFQRGWRQQEIARARRDWGRAVSRQEARRQLLAEVTA